LEFDLTLDLRFEQSMIRFDKDPKAQTKDFIDKRRLLSVTKILRNSS